MFSIATAFRWVTDLLSIGVLWLTVIALIAGGVYLILFFRLRAIRIVGGMLTVAGLILGGYAHGKGEGAAECEARWTQKNLEARLKFAEQESKRLSGTVDFLKKRNVELELSDADRTKQIEEAAVAAAKSADAQCRKRTLDDARRVCKITRNTAPGCSSIGKGVP